MTVRHSSLLLQSPCGPFEEGLFGGTIGLSAAAVVMIVAIKAVVKCMFANGSIQEQQLKGLTVL